MKSTKIMTLAGLLAVLLATAGCGQKGPLYLPEPGEEPKAQMVSTQQLLS